MTRLFGLAPSLTWRAALWTARQYLPSWVVGSDSPQSHGSSRWADTRDRKRLGRALRPDQLKGDGIVLGFLNRRVIQSPREDNALLLGVQRSGKTSSVVVPTLLAWSGTVVATSTKEELVNLTLQRRLQIGPVWVFAPLDEDSRWLERVGLESSTWNPLESAATSGAAAELADLFTADGKRGQNAHWYLAAASLISGLVACEREQGGDMRSVVARLNRTTPTQYVGLAKSVKDSIGAELLLAYALTPEKEAGSIASTARSSLSLWNDERVASATRSTENAVDLDRLLDESGTLYLVAPAEDAERCRPLFSALVMSLLRKATARARRLGGVLSPRLLIALDEAANFARIPRLAGYASSGPGQGIQLLLCYHDLAQIESGYGQDEARTIWNNCRARLLLPGQGDIRTLEIFSRAIGDETRIYRSRQSDSRYSSSIEQRIGKPLAAVDELRRMVDGVLLYANAPPARLQLRRWDQVNAWRQLVGPLPRSLVSAGSAGKGETAWPTSSPTSR
jgi:type IV secretion system protein VirD4